MPSAFVLMPFDKEFTSIYEEFLRPVLSDAGFDVNRADDIESQRNILRDVLEGISRADLIVADLTSANPNVFYELGLAHALKQPVVLLTQSIDEVPFDLRSYRLLEYSTHFATIEKAKEQLTRYAKTFLEGTLSVGSPITDFYQGGAKPILQTEIVQHRPEDEDQRGFLDHLIDVTNGYNSIAGVIAGMTNDLLELNRSLEAATVELTQINANPSASSPVPARNVCRRLAERLERFNSRLNRANGEYTNIAQDTEDSLEFLVSFQLEQSEVTNPEVIEQIASLRQLHDIAIEARDSQLQMAASMANLPRMERRLNREVARGSEEARVMATNLDKTIASISRALNQHA